MTKPAEAIGKHPSPTEGPLVKQSVEFLAILLLHLLSKLISPFTSICDQFVLDT